MNKYRLKKVTIYVITAISVVSGLITIAVFINGKSTLKEYYVNKSNNRKHESFYLINLIYPSSLTGCKIYVNEKPADIVKRTELTAQLKVSPQKNAHKIVVTKGQIKYSKEVLISKNNLNVFIGD
jgi:hypothetical protein